MTLLVNRRCSQAPDLLTLPGIAARPKNPVSDNFAPRSFTRTCLVGPKKDFDQSWLRELHAVAVAASIGALQ